jgi:hypothetical protein
VQSPASAGNEHQGQGWNVIGTFIVGGLLMFDRTQLYVGAALLGAFELAVVLMRTVVR